MNERTTILALGARLVIREVPSAAEATAALARLTPAVFGMDVVKAGVSLTTYFAAEAAAKEGCCAVLSGGGSEEILAGYARHAARPADAAALGISGLRSLHHRDLQRDHAAARLHGLEMHHPFLSAHVVAFAHSLPGRLKILPGGGGGVELHLQSHTHSHRYAVSSTVGKIFKVEFITVSQY